MNKINIFASAAIAAIASGAMLLLPACAEDKASEQTASINQPTEVVTQAPTESLVEETAQPSETTEPNENTVDVLTIKTDSYYGSGTHFFRGYDINETVRFSTKKDAPDNTRTIEFAGNKYELKYTQTIEYVLLNTVVDEYEVITDNPPASASDREHVELLPDGTPYAILTESVSKINMNDCKTGEDVRKAVELTLKDEIDFSAFDVCKTEDPIPEADYIYYRIFWYKSISGILTNNYISVSVDPDGNVFALWMPSNADLGLDNVPDNINLNDYTKAFDARLREAYGEKLVKYEINRDSARLTNINGSPCIDVEIAVDFYEDGYSDPITDLVELAAVIKP